jgi:tetratricopeptide (TPR) repeat protein
MAQLTLRDYLQETEDVISNGHVDDALARCQYVLARFPEALEAQRLLGEIYLKQGHLDEAQQTFDWVLTNDPENVIVYCDRALISEHKADYDTALDCYQQAYELSRGNSNIRNEFNKLSAKVGQQGFMFSRAGLARLYMRGDLLTQAIQEWEAVLAATPDRLDARTGLLEAYWRDGLYDRVEQLATQILQDVPGCAKALVLLAYVISARDMEQAHELLQRAEVLDPDLVMAQDLFTDMMASQPNEPFFALLKRPLVGLEKSQEKESIPSISGALSQSQELFASSGTASSAGSTFSWSGLETWNSDNTFVQAPPSAQPSLPSSNLPVWSNDNFAAMADTRSIVDRSQNGTADTNREQGQPDLSAYLNAMSSSGSSWDLPAQPTQQSPLLKDKDEDQPSEPWMLLQESLGTMKESVAQDQPSLEATQWSDLNKWNDVDKLSEVPVNGLGRDSDVKDLDMASFASSWSSSSKGADSSSPPAWLDMLSQGDLRQMSGSMPALSPSEPVAPSIPPISAQLKDQHPAEHQSTISPSSLQPPVTQEPQRPVAKQQTSSPASEKVPTSDEKEPAFAPFASSFVEEEEESFFGPEWLKALGAASMDAEESPEPAEETSPVAQDAQHQTSPVFDTWTAAVPETAASPVQEQKPEVQWKQPADQESQAPSSTPVWSQPSGTGSSSSVSSSGQSWDQSFELEQSAPYSKHEQATLDDVLPPVPPAASTWNLPAEAEASVPLSENIWGRSSEVEQYSEPASEKVWERPGEVAWGTRPLSAENEYAFETSQPAPVPEATGTEPASVPADQREQQLLVTLEELEKNLRSNGFVPLEPNWLSTLAQEQNVPSVPPTEENVSSLPTWAQETYTESPLSTAFAELGNFGQPSPAPASPIAEPVAEEQPSFTQSTPVPAVPSWAASLSATPSPVPVPPKPEVLPVEEDLALDDGDAPTTHVAAVKRPTGSPARAVSPRPVPPPTKKLVEPVKAEPLKQPAEPMPVAHRDALMDMQLETTMKRPAVRLQPVQQRPPASRESSSGSSKGRFVEQSMAGKTPGADVNYQERLLKGYQHQLVGDYDEAMQEYRTIIRNAPELLSEVISNVRALLKLAPKYSAGYRVLGDAYMRQGEYLQAMEAYNKALTMAKKAKA